MMMNNLFFFNLMLPMIYILVLVRLKFRHNIQVSVFFVRGMLVNTHADIAILS